MKSPFPGLDPYLESHWRDIHASLMVYARDELNSQLPADLQIRVEESIAIGDDEDEDASRVVYPDIRVVESLDTEFELSPSAFAVAVAEPELLVVGGTPPERHLEIVDLASGRRVVTAIEVLSPGNKDHPAGRAAYHRKQKEYLQGGVNLVEIDLIRSGQYVCAFPDEQRPRKCRKPCQVCVRRTIRPGVAEFYPISLREPLPNIRIPLRPRDPDIVLQLQPLLDNSYRQGRYSTIDYSRPPQPPLDPDDATWADSLLREKGLRGASPGP